MAQKSSRGGREPPRSGACLRCDLGCRSRERCLAGESSEFWGEGIVAPGFMVGFGELLGERLHSARAEAREGALPCPVPVCGRPGPPPGGGLSCRRAAMPCARCSPGHESWAMRLCLRGFVVPPSLSQRGRCCSSGRRLHPRLRPGLPRSGRPVRQATLASSALPALSCPPEPSGHMSAHGGPLRLSSPCGVTDEEGVAGTYDAAALNVSKIVENPRELGSAGYKGPGYQVSESGGT